MKYKMSITLLISIIFQSTFANFERLYQKEVNKCQNMDSKYIDTSSYEEVICLEAKKKAKKEKRELYDIYEELIDPPTTELSFTSVDVMKNNICSNTDRIESFKKIQEIKEKSHGKWEKVPNVLSAKEMYCGNIEVDTMMSTAVFQGILTYELIPQFYMNKENEAIANTNAKARLEKIAQEKYNRDGVLANKWAKIKEHELFKKTVYMNVIAWAAIGVLFALPESTTNWNKEELLDDKNVFEFAVENWKDHGGQTPVIDKDEFIINYGGHTLSGAYYYMLARKSGLNWWKSFLYTAFMSTFYWEFGYEGLFEIPSIQDLFITPILGSILGEIFFQLSEIIIENNGKLLNSKFLGTAALIMMDPLTPLTALLDKHVGGVFENAHFETFSKELYDPSNTSDIGRAEYVSGAMLVLPFNP